MIGLTRGMAKPTKTESVTLDSPPSDNFEVPGDVETIDENDLRAQLAAARARNAVLEAAVGLPDVEDDPASPFVNAKRLTHPHDIERFWRLGKLSPKDVLRFQESGQLPKPAVEA